MIIRKQRLIQKSLQKFLHVRQTKTSTKITVTKVLSKSKRDFDKAVQQLKINEYFDEELQEAKEVMSRFRHVTDEKDCNEFSKQKAVLKKKRT